MIDIIGITILLIVLKIEVDIDLIDAFETVFMYALIRLLLSIVFLK